MTSKDHRALKLTKADAERIIGDQGWLALVPTDFRSEILRRSILLSFSPGEYVFRQGDPPGGIYGLVAGTVSASSSPAGASPRLILLGIPGYWTGEGCFLTRQPRRGEIRAIVETTMLHVPLETLNRMSACHPEIVHYIAQILMMTVDLLFHTVYDLQKTDAASRIAAILHRTASIGDQHIPLTQADLGVMANASRKQVNAVLKQFAAAGWLEKSYRFVRIIDPDALRRFADEERPG